MAGRHLPSQLQQRGDGSVLARELQADMRRGLPIAAAAAAARRGGASVASSSATTIAASSVANLTDDIGASSPTPGKHAVRCPTTCRCA